MGGSAPKNTTQTSKVELPEWVNRAGAANYNFARGVSYRPYEPYRGDTVADMPAAGTQGQDYFMQNMGSFNDDTQRGIDSTTGLLGYTPEQIQAQQVQAGQFKNSDLSPYMNPYLENVESYALGNLDRARLGALNSNADRGFAAGAFGGSRQALTDAITNSESIRSAGELSAGIRNQGFNTSAGLLTGDLDRTLTAQRANQSAALTAGQSNQAAGLAGAQFRLGAAQQLGQQAQQGRQGLFQDYLGSQDVADRQRSFEQQNLDDQYKRFAEKRDYPIEQLNIRLAALGATPYGKTQTTIQSNPNTSSPFTSILGGVNTAAGLFSLFSDPRLKKNVKKVGKVGDLGVYDYQWKGQPSSAPKTRGLLSTDVRKKVPGAVGTDPMSGFDTVDYGHAISSQVAKLPDMGLLNPQPIPRKKGSRKSRNDQGLKRGTYARGLL